MSDSYLYTIGALRPSENELQLSENPSVSIEIPVNYKSTIFTLITSPVGWIVQRKTEDFIWLRECLSSIYPGLYIPPSPPKRTKNLDYTKFCLQRLIKFVLKNYLLKTSPYLLAFLKESESKTFDQIKREGGRSKKPESVSENWTITGTLVCDPIQCTEWDKVFKEYLSQTETLRKKIKNQCEKLVEKVGKVAKELNDISLSFLSLESIQQKYTEVLSMQVPANSHMYSALRTTFEAWSCIESQSIEIVQKYMLNYYKYGYEDMKVLRVYLNKET